MPDDTELATLADIKTLLRITSSGEDSLLTIIKDAVEQDVKNFCGRDFLIPSSAYTEYHDGDGTRQLRALQRPITDITSIHVDGGRNFADVSLIATSKIITDAEARVLGYIELFNASFLVGIKNVQLIYKAGYAAIPKDLSLAVKTIVCKIFKVADKQMWAQGSQTAGDLVITLTPDAWPKDARKTLDRYRRMDF